MSLEISIKNHYQISKQKKDSDGKKTLSYILNYDFKILNNKLSDQKKESFYAELAILSLSGIDIRTALEIIIEEQTKPVTKNLFQHVYQEIIEGKPLSEALYMTKQFSLYEYYCLKIGEESGKLREVMNDLTLYYSRKIKQNRQLKSAFTYPFLVTITAFVAVYFMLRFIVPMFTEVFKRFHGELPPLTRLVVSISETFPLYLTFIFAFLALAVLFYILYHGKIWFRKKSTALILKIPFLGLLINKIYLARFCQSMSLLLSSKTPMLKSLQLVKKMISFYPYESALEGIEKDILHGNSLYVSMQKYSIFDKRIVALTRIAEEVNQLDKVYNKLNNQYSEELEHQIGLLGNILEPIMIVLVGILVAVILISMYLPLFQMSTSIF